MLSQSTASPFSTTTILDIPELLDNYESAWHGFRFDGSLENTVFYLPEVTEPKLPSLELGIFRPTNDDVPSPTLESFEQPQSEDVEHAVSEDKNQSDGAADRVEEDIWRLPDVLDTRKRTKLLNWDQFRDPNHKEPQTTYLAEAGAEVFDAVLQSVSTAETVSTIVQADYFFTALLDLCMGQSSALFLYDQKKRCFVSELQNPTPSGFSPLTIQQLTNKLSITGQQTIAIKQKYQDCIDRPAALSQRQIALYTMTNSCANAVKEHLQNHKYHVASLLQLQSLCSGPSSLIELCNSLQSAATKSSTHIELLRKILDEASSLRIAHPELDSVLQATIAAIAEPIFSGLSLAIGLASNNEQKILYADTSEATNTPQSMQFLLQECRDLAEEAQTTFILLEKNAPQKVPDANAVLQVGLTWDRIHELSVQASQFETDAKATMLRPGSSDGSQALAIRLPKSTPAAVQDLIPLPYALDANLDRVVTQLCQLSSPNNVYNAALHCLTVGEHQSPSLEPDYEQAISWSLLPMLSAQHRLLSCAALEFLFVDGQLLEHLRLQQQIHLLGSGPFALQLSTSLFSMDQTGYDGRRHAGGAMGLRLQARDTWPPATSELRLVLMGILSDAITNPKSKTLEDTISFAIRDLSDDDLEKCRDINSIHALDFLRIQYRPPNQVIETIITAASLEKYDHIFRYLLNLLRVHKAAEVLLRNACSRQGAIRTKDHLFRVQIHRFVSALAAHGHHVAIGLPWARLEQKMIAIEHHVAAGNYEGTLAHGISLKHLQGVHQHCLEEISRGLLLKQKQQSARMVLDDIFGIILHFSALTMHESHAVDDEIPLTTKRLYDQFKEQVRKFVGLVHSSATEFENSSVKSDRINVFEDLLVSLDMSGYWVPL